MKKCDYVQLYADRFGLNVKFYPNLQLTTLSEADSVVGWQKSEDKYFNYINEKGKLSKCKTTDLSLAIFNNTYIHKK